MSKVPHECALEERLGAVGTASLWRGTWQDAPALLLVRERTKGWEERAAFARVGRHMRRLAHPALARCLGAVDGDPPAIVLEPMEGMPLRTRLDDAPLSPGEVLRMARDLLQVLASLHHSGALHLELSPERMWVRPDGSVVLLDLGQAAEAGGRRGGTHAAYQAPEQLERAELDHRTDLYALGVVLYEAASGRRPNEGTSAATWLAAHQRGAARRLADLVPDAPSALFVLVERLMAVDRAHRPMSAEAAVALCDDLRDAVPRPARLIGRAAALGALQAVIDGGGILRVTGEVGSGVAAILQVAKRLGEEAAMSVFTVRVEAGDAVRQVAERLGLALTQVDQTTPQTPAAVAEALGRRAVEQRVLLVVSDIDLATERVIPWLQGLGTGGRVVMVWGGYRQRVEGPGRLVALRPLELPEIRSLLVSMLGASAAPPGLDVSLMRRTAGLPGLVVTVIREMARRGALWRAAESDDAWDWDPAVRITAGQAHEPILARWLGDLGIAGRATLDALAAADGRLPLSVLLTVMGAVGHSVDVMALRGRGLVWTETRDGEDWVQLRGPLTWLLQGARTRDPALHARIGEAVRAREGGPWDRQQLVLQEVAAGPEGDAVVRLVELADHLGRVGRADGAMELLARVPADLVLPLPTQAHIAAVRCDVLLSLGRSADAEAALHAAQALHAEEPIAELRDRLHCLAVDVALAAGGDPTLATPALKVAVGGPWHARREVLAGEVALRCGQLAEAGRAFSRALKEVAPPQGDRTGWRAVVGAASTRVQRGEVPRAFEELERLDREMVGGPLLRETAWTIALLAELAGRLGRIGEATLLVGRAMEVAERARAPFAHAIVTIAHAEILLRAGAVERSDELLANIGAFGSSSVPYAVRLRWLRAMAELRAAQGEVRAATLFCASGGEAAAAAKDPIAESAFIGFGAAMDGEHGLVERALDELDRRRATPEFCRLAVLAMRHSGYGAALARAEHETRRSKDKILLIEILDAARPAEAADEIRTLGDEAIAGVFGPVRDAFFARPELRRAGRGRGGRDTRA